MITAKAIAEANKAIKKTPIKGKDYAPVHERVKAIRMIDPECMIETEVIEYDKTSILIKATVKTSDGRVLGTGHAQEEKGKGMINSTSYVENCETSAIGRALASCGIGIDTDIASLNEVVGALERQRDEIERVQENPQTRITSKQVRSVVDQCAVSGVSVSDVCGFVGVPGLEDLTYPQYWNLTKKWSDIVKKIKASSRLGK